MKIILVIWAAIVLVTWVAIGVSMTGDKIYYGNEIILEESNERNIRIETETSKVEIEGTSTNYFQLKKGQEILYSIPKNPPLCYKGDYFVLEKQFIGQGEWIVKQSDDINIILKSNENIMLTTIYGDTLAFWFLTFFLAAFVWFIGLAILCLFD